MGAQAAIDEMSLEIIPPERYSAILTEYNNLDIFTVSTARSDERSRDARTVTIRNAASLDVLISCGFWVEQLNMTHLCAGRAEVTLVAHVH